MANFGFQRYRTAPYKPGQKQPYKLSRSKIEDFVNCERCFWLDRRLKISRPQTPPFQINKAVDELFKKEFDTYRKDKKAHPIMKDYKIDAIPYMHEKLDDWRENFVGVQYLEPGSNLLVFGAVDDVWVNKKGELIVVDYKATAKKSEVSLDAPWQISYKRQMEVYQWLLRKNGFAVSNKGYFVYTNGRLDLDGFFDKVEFRTKIIEYEGNDKWIDPTIKKIKECLEQKDMPASNIECEYCKYARMRTELTIDFLRNNKKKLVK